MTAPERVEVAGPQEGKYYAAAGEAWMYLRRCSEAGVKLSAALVIRARDELRRAEISAGNAAVEFAAVVRGIEEWERRGDGAENGG